MFIDETARNQLIESMVKTHGDQNRTRITKGVERVAALWNENDGTSDEFSEFCTSSFIGDDSGLNLAFERFDNAFETLHGHFNAMSLNLRKPLDEDLGEIQPYDMLLGEFDPSAHLTDDLFKNKIAFLILLNFSHYTLSEKQTTGESWTPKQWALARVGDLFKSRVPAELQQKLSSVITAADTYVAEYNIFMGQLRENNNKSLFPEDLKLITHWGLRDELKGHYGAADAADKQEIIYEVMKRIITQEIPKEVINSKEITWNPYKNTVGENNATSAPEPNDRYQHILNSFNIMQKIDDYYPAYPTYIKRKFELEREMPEAEVEQLFSDFLSSNQLKKVASLIEKRLGRNLRPYDIWYDGFKSRSSIPEDKLNKIVSSRYKNKDAFASDLPNIMSRLGFSDEQVKFVIPKIEVDASRGAGHAWGASMKDGKAHLRMRVPEGGMDYKGFNVGMHEFGHTVEQTLSLHKVDHHMIHGVPFSAFSEAFAFVFQNRDLEMLDMKNEDPNAGHLDNLDLFWATCEIMGVSLVDMQIWNWLYANPKADAEALKNATIKASKDIWNKFFADAFGMKDAIILGVYSHMIGYPLYLAEYPLGHVMQFQIEKHLEGKNLGSEMERMCAYGSVIPQLWMKHAVGSEISVKPILASIDEALKVIIE
ncbi:MAG: hypothetical protein KAR42_03825 [candidate division Zixibacteria bacterium]|nr:hypothetical protein [candidate division Zixibacteria bacterium]